MKVQVRDRLDFFTTFNCVFYYYPSVSVMPKPLHGYTEALIPNHMLP